MNHKTVEYLERCIILGQRYYRPVSGKGKPGAVIEDRPVEFRKILAELKSSDIEKVRL